MKIHDLTTKQALEVEATDLLVIEDAEETKAITVAEFMECVGIHTDRRTKEIVNDAIDKVIEALEGAKFKFDYDKYFKLNIWIGSPSGNIQFSILDPDTNKWLTRDELINLLGPVEDVTDPEEKYERSYIIKALIADMYQQSVAYEIRNFNDDHPSGTNQWLEECNAGYIKAHFENLTQNEIAGITHTDISVTMDDVVDENVTEYHYHFVSEEDSFVNAVPFEMPIVPPFENEYPTPEPEEPPVNEYPDNPEPPPTGEETGGDEPNPPEEGGTTDEGEDTGIGDENQGEGGVT